jgi:hypothetical protein
MGAEPANPTELTPGMEASISAISFSVRATIRGSPMDDSGTAMCKVCTLGASRNPNRL